MNADDEWECSNALTELENQVVSFAVLDATGAQVGSTIFPSGFNAILLLEVDLDRRILLTVNKSGIVRNLSASVFFQSADCSGIPWIITGLGFDPAISPFVVVSGEDARQLYVATGSPSQTFQAKTRLVTFVSGPASCQPDGSTREFVPAELVDADLHITFPPPYELIIQ